MPGAFPRTSTISLTNATLPYLKTIAQIGIKDAVSEDPSLRSALNTYRGKIVHRTVAEAFSRKE